MMNFVCLSANQRIFFFYIYFLLALLRALSIPFFLCRSLLKKLWECHTTHWYLHLNYFASAITSTLPFISNDNIYRDNAVEIFMKTGHLFHDSFILIETCWLAFAQRKWKKDRKKLYIFNNLDVWHTATRNFFFFFFFHLIQLTQFYDLTSHFDLFT